MKVIRGFPPNYREINKAFNVRGKPVLFCWGDRIYNPSNGPVAPAILLHEEIHCQQQFCGGPEWWWSRYIADPAFRLDQELPAHRAEWGFYQPLSQTVSEGFLDLIAERLSSPLYGNLIDYEEARRRIAA